MWPEIQKFHDYFILFDIFSYQQREQCSPGAALTWAQRPLCPQPTSSWGTAENPPEPQPLLARAATVASRQVGMKANGNQAFGPQSYKRAVATEGKAQQEPWEGLPQYLRAGRRAARPLCHACLPGCLSPCHSAEERCEEPRCRAACCSCRAGKLKHSSALNTFLTVFWFSETLQSTLSVPSQTATKGRKVSCFRNTSVVCRVLELRAV